MLTQYIHISQDWLKGQSRAAKTKGPAQLKSCPKREGLAVLEYNISYHSLLLSMSYYVTVHYTISYYTISYCIILYYIISYDIMLCYIISYYKQEGLAGSGGGGCGMAGPRAENQQAKYIDLSIYLSISLSLYIYIYIYTSLSLYTYIYIYTCP